MVAAAAAAHSKPFESSRQAVGHVAASIGYQSDIGLAHRHCIDTEKNLPDRTSSQEMQSRSGNRIPWACASSWAMALARRCRRWGASAKSAERHDEIQPVACCCSYQRHSCAWVTTPSDAAVALGSVAFAATLLPARHHSIGTRAAMVYHLRRSTEERERQLSLRPAKLCTSKRGAKRTGRHKRGSILNKRPLAWLAVAVHCIMIAGPFPVPTHRLFSRI